MSHEMVHGLKAVAASGGGIFPLGFNGVGKDHAAITVKTLAEREVNDLVLLTEGLDGLELVNALTLRIGHIVEHDEGERLSHKGLEGSVLGFQEFQTVAVSRGYNDMVGRDTKLAGRNELDGLLVPGGIVIDLTKLGDNSLSMLVGRSACS